jgi:hypothetical protein
VLGHGSGFATGRELDDRHGCTGSPGAAGVVSAAATAGPARAAVVPTLRQSANRCALVNFISILLVLVADGAPWWL